MTKHVKFKKQMVLGGICVFGFSGLSYGQMEDMSSNIEADISNAEEYNEINSTEEAEANPFMNLSSTLEKLQLKQRERQSELSLIESEIELQRKEFEKEMLPFQMEIERAKMQQELYDVQDSLQEPTPPPSISMDDIENRIDVVAGDLLKQQKNEIEELKEERRQRINRENTFSLKLISRNPDGEVYSIISSAEGEDYKVEEGDFANDWEVLGIDSNNNKVIVSKDGNTEVVSPENNALSIIENNRRQNNNESESGGNEDMDNIPEPNF